MKDLKNKKAFSLVELSVVILIIGIIIAGISQSSRLIAQFKLSSARTQTDSSPVTSIKGLTNWYEATLETSFDEDETDDRALNSSSDAISTWYDNNSTDGTRRNATAASTEKPAYYADCINDLPCVRFDGTDDTMVFDGTAIVGSDYTVFALVQRRAAAANYFIGNSASAAANAGLGFGYTGTTTLMISQADISNANTVTIAGYTANTPQIHAIVQDSVTQGSSSIAHYLNGSATASTLADVGTPNFDGLSAYADAALGSNHNDTSEVFFNGDIGEVIIYNRALKTEERVAVEDYLDKKWAIN